VRRRRSKKAVQNIYKFFYYSLAATFGYITMKDSYIMPTFLGGHGSLYNQFLDYPYIKYPPLYKFYFTGTMGYHVASILKHLFSKEKSNDYLEMLLHHLCTIYLYGFSYMTNCLIGGVVSFIHDLPDIPIAWTRAWSESEYKTTTAVSFAFSLVVWLCTRLTALPYIIYVTIFRLELYVKSPYIQPIYGILLSCLFFLHIYWFILCVGILANFFTKGVAEDL
jgi:hypothetical protein